MQYFRSMIESMIRFRWAVLLLAIASMIASALIVLRPLSWLPPEKRTNVYFDLFSLRLEFDFSPESLFVSNDPELDFYRDFFKHFKKNDDLVAIAVSSDELFSTPVLGMIEELGHDLQKIEGVTEVTSLLTTDYITPSDEGFSVEPFIEKIPSKQDKLGDLKRKALEQRLFRGQLISEDATATTVLARLDENLRGERLRDPVVSKIEELAAEYDRRHPEAQFYVAGIPASQKSIIEMLKRDQRIFLPLAALMMCVVLLLLFRGVWGMAMPMLVITTTLAWTTAIMVLLGEPVNIINNVIFVLILVYGIADSIHIQSRYREELARGRSKREAVTVSMTHLAMANLLTSFTTAIGFASLYVANMDLIQRMGIFAAMGIMLAYVATIVLMPPLLSLLPPLPMKKGRDDESGFLARQMDRLATFVLHRYRWLGVSALFLFAAGIAGAFFLTVESRMLEELDPDHPSQVALHFMEDKLAGVLPFDISVRSVEPGRLKDPDVLTAMDGLKKLIESHKSVSKTISLGDFLKQMNYAMYEGKPEAWKLPTTREANAQYLLLLSMADGDADLSDVVTDDYSWGRIIVLKRDWGTVQFFELVKMIENYIDKNFPDDLDVRITGSSYVAARGIDNIVSDMISSLITSIIIIGALMMMLFRSVRLGLLSMIPNVIPIIATIGFMGLTDIKLRIATVIIFSVALGIAIDNTIHLLARFRSEYEKDFSYEGAIRRTLRNTGRALLFAWLILSMGIGVISFSNFVALRDFSILTVMTVSTALIGALAVMTSLLLIFRPMKPKQEEIVQNPTQNAA